MAGTRRISSVLKTGLRVGLCVGAIAFVARSVDLNDRVQIAVQTAAPIQALVEESSAAPPTSAVPPTTASAATESYYGRVIVQDDRVTLDAADGTHHAWPMASVAKDEQGQPLISLGLRSAWSQSDGRFLIAAVFVFALVPFLQALRIRMLLAAQEIHVGYWEALKLSFAGNFLNFAAPLGSTAGDVFKAYYFSLHTRRKTEAMAVVFLDRVLGLGTLVTVVALITLVSPANSVLSPLRGYMLFMLIAGFVGAAVFASGRLQRIPSVRALIGRLPGGDHLLRANDTALAMIRSWASLAAAFGTTVVLQMIAALAFFMVAIAVGMAAHAGNALEYYAYFSSGELIKSLPGPPQGLGTMELAYAYFFAAFGSASQIVCAAFAIRMVMLVCSLPGLLVTMTGAYRPADATRPVADQAVGQTGVLQPQLALDAV